MTPERWKLAQKMLDAVLERPLEERDQALNRIADDDLRNEVISLIQAIETEDTRLDHGAKVEASLLDDLMPSEVGPYRLLSPLGEGGMGTVYLAERQDNVHHKQVAVKLLRGSFVHAELKQRFRGEREILAHLDHPNIARLLDGGATPEGLPYLVMEYVEGQDFDDYCDVEQLSIPQRLQLFLKVCEAVQFAHRNLIVHRDLKPSNIMVTQEGEPKLLDFGIAKLLSPDSLPMTMIQTRTGGGPLTPAYASPEQLTGGAITTASDVYSLGVLLYELLTGQRPYDTRDTSLDSIVQQLSGTPPTLPSHVVHQKTAKRIRSTDTEGPQLDQVASLRQSEPQRLGRQLKGDLDSIALKALSPTPESRYASAEQLADDLQRHLDGLPVRAREGTFSYRSVKFLKRHRWAMTATAIVFLLLVAFIATLLTQREEISSQSLRAQTTADFLAKLFFTIDPISGSSTHLKAKDLLDRGRDNLDKELADLPGVRANLLAVIGRAYLNLGDLELSESTLREALLLRQATYPENSPEVAESEQLMCMILNNRGRYDEAEAACAQALKIYRQLGGEPQSGFMDGLFRMARVLAEKESRQDESQRLFEQAISIARQIGDDNKLGLILYSYATAKSSREENKEALALYQEALLLIKKQQDDHQLIVSILEGMAGIHSRLGNGTLALELLREAQSLCNQINGSEHPKVGLTLVALGKEQSVQGQYMEAEESLTEGLRVLRKSYGASHPRVASVLTYLARVYTSLERFDEAKPMALEALKIRRELLGNDNIATAYACDFLASVYSNLNEHDKAGALYSEALSIHRQAQGDRNPATANALNNYALYLDRRGLWIKAAPLYRQSMDVLIEVNGPLTRDAGFSTYNLARTLHRLGEIEEAETLYLKAIEILTSFSGGEHPAIVAIKSRLGNLWIDRGDIDAAAPMVDEMLELAERKYSMHSVYRGAQRFQGHYLLVTGRYEEAEAVLRPLLDRALEAKGIEDNETRDLVGHMIELYEKTGRPSLMQEMKELRAKAFAGTDLS